MCSCLLIYYLVYTMMYILCFVIIYLHIYLYYSLQYVIELNMYDMCKYVMLYYNKYMIMILNDQAL